MGNTASRNEEKEYEVTPPSLKEDPWRPSEEEDRLWQEWRRDKAHFERLQMETTLAMEEVVTSDHYRLLKSTLRRYKDLLDYLESIQPLFDPQTRDQLVFY